MASSKNLTAGGTFRNRVKALRFVRAGDLAQNPKNWRKHSDFQRQSLAAMVNEIGFADALIARETPEGLVLIDGHLRSKLDPEANVPVLIVDLNEAESDKLLATLDPLAGLADVDIPALDELLKEVETQSEDVQDLLFNIGRKFGIEPPDFLPEPEDEQGKLDEKSTSKIVVCPECGHEFTV